MMFNLDRFPTGPDCALSRGKAGPCIHRCRHALTPHIFRIHIRLQCCRRSTHSLLPSSHVHFIRPDTEKISSPDTMTERSNASVCLRLCAPGRAIWSTPSNSLPVQPTNRFFFPAATGIAADITTSQMDDIQVPMGEWWWSAPVESVLCNVHKCDSQRLYTPQLTVLRPPLRGDAPWSGYGAPPTLLHKQLLLLRIPSSQPVHGVITSNSWVRPFAWLNSPPTL